MSDRVNGGVVLVTAGLTGGLFALGYIIQKTLGVLL